MGRAAQDRAAQFSLTVVCLALGILLVTQFRTQGKYVKSVLSASSTEQATIISSLYDHNLALRREVNDLEDKLHEHERSLSQSNLDSMVKELNDLRIINGLSEVSGPGVELTISREVRAQDLLDLVNELRNAGAEAIALNGVRITAQTAIYVDATRNYVSDTPVEAPYALSAIGQPETIERALLRKGGLVTYLESTYPNATIIVVKRDKLVLPQYRSSYTFKYAKPAK